MAFRKAMPVTLQVTLQQGATVTNPGNGAASNYFSNTVLTGNIKRTGISLFQFGRDAIHACECVSSAIWWMQDF